MTLPHPSTPWVEQVVPLYWVAAAEACLATPRPESCPAPTQLQGQGVGQTAHPHCPHSAAPSMAASVSQVTYTVLEGEGDEGRPPAPPPCLGIMQGVQLPSLQPLSLILLEVEKH